MLRRHVEAAPVDVLAPYRRRVLLPSCFAVAVALVPLALHDLAIGRVLIGMAGLVGVAGLSLDALALLLRRKPPVPVAVLLVPLTVLVTLSLPSRGLIAACWCYPAVIFAYFVLPRWQAHLSGGVFVALATWLSWRHLGAGVGMRVGLSLLLTVVIVQIIQAAIRVLEGRLVEQSISDPLTGAFNRRYLASRTEQIVEEGRRHATRAALLLIDIDQFKGINDRLGHAAGDEVLKGLVARIKARARRLDLLFRIGGEEFVLLLPRTDAAGAVSVAEELRGDVERNSLLQKETVTISIGVAELATDDSVESWVKRADAALYAAKQGGRNRVMLGDAVKADG